MSHNGITIVATYELLWPVFTLLFAKISKNISPVSVLPPGVKG